MDADYYQRVYEAIVQDSRYRANLDWGEARPGHPEATVRAHIDEIENNLEVLKERVSGEDYWKLKVLIHTHDGFKADVEPGVTISHPKSHASLAREFLSTFCEDNDLLAMVQNHDEPFALYRQFENKGKYNVARLETLISSIHDWNLFLAFTIIDGCTVGKSRDPLRWFFQEIDGRVESSFAAGDILD